MRCVIRPTCVCRLSNGNLLSPLHRPSRGKSGVGLSVAVVQAVEVDELDVAAASGEPMKISGEAASRDEKPLNVWSGAVGELADDFVEAGELSNTYRFLARFDFPNRMDSVASVRSPFHRHEVDLMLAVRLKNTGRNESRRSAHRGF